MKIFNCLFTEALGGMEQSFLDYNEALSDLGHEVISILHKNSKIKDQIKGQAYFNNNRSKHDPLAALQLWRLVRTQRPDIIITHGNRAHYLMNLVRGKAITIGICHGNVGYITRSHFILTVSQSLRNSILEKHPEQQGKVFFLPNLVRIPKESQYREKISHKPVSIGFIGRLDREKGVDVFIDALSHLKQAHIPFKASIAGDGYDKGAIQDQIRNLNLEDEIELMGWVFNKNKFYSKVDIVCMPSYYEPFGIVALEALSHGIPLIVSNLPGPTEIVQDEKSALLIQPGDNQGLADAIKRLIEDAPLYHKLGKQGYERAHDFSYDQFKAKLKTTLDTFL